MDQAQLKAKELIEMFWKAQRMTIAGAATIQFEGARASALICVDEMIKFGTETYDSDLVHFRETGHFEFLESVKEAIRQYKE